MASEHQADRPVGTEAVFDLADFRLESGQTLARLRIAHVVYGRMNAARDNVILIMPGTSNTSNRVPSARTVKRVHASTPKAT